MNSRDPIEWSTRETKRTLRQNGKCKCGKRYSRLVDSTFTRTYRSDLIGPVSTSEKRIGDVALTCTCGKHVWMRDVKGTYRAEKKCDARCLNSTGHVCECSCGGKNHGGGNG